MQNYKSKVNPRNQVFVKKIKDLAKSYSIVGIVDVLGLPAPQFQKIRASLNGKAEVLIVKKNLIKLTLNELEKNYKNISNLSENIQGIVGLIFTNENPFSLYKFVKKNKSSAPAKQGDIAPNDIVVSAGPTNFAPGPIIGELGAFKIKAGINAGKVEIKQDSVVAKSGDEISLKLAEILTRLGIEPMEVGLNIKAVYENQTIYLRDVLDVDEEAVILDIENEVKRCFALSVGLNYVTCDNVDYFISKGFRESLNLGLKIAYPASETIKNLLSKAESEMVNVSSVLPKDLRPAGVVTSVADNVKSANEEPKVEEKKEEPKANDAGMGLGDLF